jgi:hypothetical protein
MKTASQRLWLPWTRAAERTTLEAIQYGCDITSALIMELRSATLRRFERLRSREQIATSQKATSLDTRERFGRSADLKGITSGAFKHYFLIADEELPSEDVQLAIRAFRKFRSSHPEFESFRLIVARAAAAVSQGEPKSLGRSTEGIENVRCYQLTGGEEDLSRLYRYCYAVIATSSGCSNTVAFLESRRFNKPIIAISRAAHGENSDRDRCDVLCEATPEALASSMAQLAHGSDFIDSAMGTD